MYDTERRSGGIKEQRCTWCHALQPVGEFFRNPETGWITHECRTCATERLRLWALVDKTPVVSGRRYVDADSPTAVCARCGRNLPKDAFYTYSGGSSDRLYLRARCKQCMGAQNNTYKPAYRRSEHVQRINRDRWLRKQYGIGVDEFDRLLAAQDGRCAICRTAEPGGPTPESAFHVDHNHATNRVRGLLCRACNTAIGLLNEDADRFASAVVYLRE